MNYYGHWWCVCVGGGLVKVKESHAKASMHSSSFDSNNRNQGGQYAKYPFDTSTFKWE